MYNIKDTMAQDTINIPEKEGSSAAAIPQKTYSAKELAEVFLTSRLVFFSLDLEIITNNWNYNYIFEFLYYVRDFQKMDEAVECLDIFWIEKHDVYASYDITKNCELERNRKEFEDTLLYIRGKVREKISLEERKKKLKEKVYNDYTSVSETDCSSVLPPEQNCTTTESPKYPVAIQNQGNNNPTPLVKLEDLPMDIRKKVLVSQEVFDVFVRQLNEDLWLTVVKNKTQFCGCIFFLSNFHYITSRDTKANEFAQLLSIVVVALKGKGSIESSIRRRNEVIESNIDRSYKCYACADVNKSMEKEIYKLRNDCKCLVDGFQPVLDAMKEEEARVKAVTNQAIQASQST